MLVKDEGGAHGAGSVGVLSEAESCLVGGLVRPLLSSHIHAPRRTQHAAASRWQRVVLTRLKQS